MDKKYLVSKGMLVKNEVFYYVSSISLDGDASRGFAFIAKKLGYCFDRREDAVIKAKAMAKKFNIKYNDTYTYLKGNRIENIKKR